MGQRAGRPDPLDESWDPADDAVADTGPDARWDWHARSSWGRRAVAAFPVAALVGAAAFFVAGTLSASSAPGAAAAASGAVPLPVPGTGGARLVPVGGPPVPTDAAAPGGTARYGVVAFTIPSGPSHPVQGSTSLALPPYVGWEANGSAGPSNGSAVAGGGLLHVGIRRATPEFRGWFLTTTGSVPDSCAFHFDAVSPPPVPSPAAGAAGELVMAVQTASTATTGDIDYAVVAEAVHADGSRYLQAGYSTGHLRNAVEHVLKSVPWEPGPLQVSVETDGEHRLEVFVDGRPFLDADGLHMGITPPFQPYLEVQAVGTPYSVAFDRYASVCGDDLVVDGLPDGTVARLGNQVVTAPDGRATFPRDRTAGPVSGPLELVMPGTAAPVRFATRTYWPGDRFTYRGPS